MRAGRFAVAVSATTSILHTIAATQVSQKAWSRNVYFVPEWFPLITSFVALFTGYASISGSVMMPTLSLHQNLRYVSLTLVQVTSMMLMLRGFRELRAHSNSLPTFATFDSTRAVLGTRVEKMTAVDY